MIGHALIACGVHTSNISRGIMLSTLTIYYYARKKERYILYEVPNCAKMLQGATVNSQRHCGIF